MNETPASETLDECPLNAAPFVMKGGIAPEGREGVQMTLRERMEFDRRPSVSLQRFRITFEHCMPSSSDRVFGMFGIPMQMVFSSLPKVDGN